MARFGETLPSDFGEKVFGESLPSDHFHFCIPTPYVGDLGSQMLPDQWESLILAPRHVPGSVPTLPTTAVPEAQPTDSIAADVADEREAGACADGELRRSARDEVAHAEVGVSPIRDLGFG